MAVATCPGCGQIGRSVSARTVHAVLLAEVATRIVAVKPRFCRSAGCDVLYYCADGRTVGSREAHVHVGIKHADDASLLCYCLGITRGDIARDIATTGTTAAPERILATIRSSTCDCEVKNPSGTFCLGDVRKVVDEIRRATRAAPLDDKGAPTVCQGGEDDGADK